MSRNGNVFVGPPNKYEMDKVEAEVYAHFQDDKNILIGGEQVWMIQRGTIEYLSGRKESLRSALLRTNLKYEVLQGLPSPRTPVSRGGLTSEKMW